MLFCFTIFLDCFDPAGVSASVLIGSLHACTSLCARPDESLTFQLFAEFPSILVPLSSDNQVLHLFLRSRVFQQNNSRLFS